MRFTNFHLYHIPGFKTYRLLLHSNFGGAPCDEIYLGELRMLMRFVDSLVGISN